MPAGGEPWVLRHFDAIGADGIGQSGLVEITAWAEQAREQAQARLDAQLESADMNGDGYLASGDLGRQFGGV